jgi:uncharacterized surface protein with fasciclin (FAS1) repeats
MKTKFTLLLGATLVFLGSAIAQTSKTLDETYSRFDVLKNKDKGNGDAKAIEAVLTATGGYVVEGTIDIPMNLILNNIDEEYGDLITITFPAGFTINSVSNNVEFGPSFDPGGDAEAYNGISGQSVSWGDDDNNYGGVTPGNDYPFSINVTADASVTGDQTIDFVVSGDGFGPAPADFTGSITISEAVVGLPLDFELPAETYSIIGFGGADNTGIIPNPDQSGINVSGNVWQQTQNSAAGETFAGAVIDLGDPVDFSESGLIAMDIWTPQAATDVTLRFEIANNDPASAGMELTLPTTSTSTWETLVFDFTDNANIGNAFVRCVVFFNLGANNTDDTFYIDNIRNTNLPTVFDIVANSDVHNTLETALIESGLDAVTSDPEVDLTLFAPTDAAFDALPEGVLASLLEDPTGALANVLLYHVVGGTALSTDLSDGQEVLTLQGETVTVAINGDVITINGAEVVIADIEAVNGVVHVIDAVLVPSTCTVVAGGPYTNFTTAFGGAPVAVDGVCPVNVIEAFESWASEAYVAAGCVEGTTYTFGLQDGASGAWDPAFLIVDATTGEVIASETEGLSITWECPADGDYIWIIQEEGLCGNQSTNTTADNGFPYMTCGDPLSSTDFVLSNDLRVFPNPTNSQFTVDIELNAAENVRIDVINVMGQVVKSVDLGTRSAGLNREYIVVNDLSEGIYFMNLTVGATQGTVKVQVVR